MNVHVVQFRSPSMLGLSLYDPYARAVLPAYAVMTAIVKPTTPRCDDMQWHRYDAAIDDLREWRGAMVEILPFGAVVGDWIVRPYLIGSHEYRILRAAMAQEH